MQSKVQAAIDARGKICGARQAVRLVEVGHGRGRFDARHAVVEPQPQRAFPVAHGVIHGVRWQAVRPADVHHLATRGVDGDQSGAEGLESKSWSGQHDAPIELRALQGLRCRKRRQ